MSERLADEVLSLPLYPELNDAEVEEVGSALRALLSLIRHSGLRNPDKA